jgi:glutathione-specific gamma-glutamylcyclotransferase
MSLTHPAPPPANTFLRWTEQERLASLKVALKDWRPGQDLWIFGYGSLIWRPEFEFVEQRAASLEGYHRSLCLWSRINRGTPETPGLVFGLEQTGTCQGMVFKISSQNVLQTFDAVWKREMGTGAYLPSWIPCATPQGVVPAMAFVIDQTGPAYVKQPPEDDLVEIICRARGTYGSCFDYVTQTAVSLKIAGICDEPLATLADRLIQRRQHQGQTQQQ